MRQYGRYGYRRITAMLRAEGWHVNHTRVERIWRKEGVQVPQKQPKRRRLGVETMGPAFGCGQSIGTVSGAMMLWRIGPVMDARYGCWW